MGHSCLKYGYLAQKRWNFNPFLAKIGVILYEGKSFFTIFKKISLDLFVDESVIFL